MRIERIQGKDERRILTAMIVDSVALSRIATKWDREMFRSRWADVVGGWCVKFHHKYGKAPRKDIQALFESWSVEAKDKDTVALVEKFLVGLSGEYETLAAEINTQHIVDAAAKHFSTVKLQRMLEAAAADLDEGQIDKAMARVSQFGAVVLGAGEAIDPLSNDAAIQAAFEETAEDLIEYPGALGQFFKGQLTRDSFVAFLAPEKRGKTFWLIDMAWRAMLQRRRVAFFSAGDMSERQMMRRLMTRAAKRPIRAKEWPCVVKIPKKMRRIDGKIEVKFEEKVFDKPLDWREAKKACEEITQYKVKGKDYLRLATYSNSTLSVKAIDAQLQIWEKEGWVPDVVLSDYADILDEDAALPGPAQPREKINASWKQQRSLSQKWHILYITATQADAAGGVTDLIRRENFSEDKRKLAHVTGMLGINQTPEDKLLNAFRLNWVAVREGEYTETATVAVAACLPLSVPAVLSCW